MNARLVVGGSVYTADIRPKKPFLVDLLRDGTEDQHQGIWQGGQILFDVNNHQLEVKTGLNGDGSKFALVPWKESTYEALEKELRCKLVEKKNGQQDTSSKN